MRIDWWTLALQTVNVLILVWLLSRFLFRPVAEIVARRQKEAGKLLADAAAARQDGERARGEAERVRAGLAAERERLLAEASAAAQAERSAQMARAGDEAAKLRADAEAAIARERVAAENALLDHASELAVEIARRLLRRLSPETATGVMLDQLFGRIGELPAATRASLGCPDGADRPLEVVTAAPLAAQDSARVRRELEAALGAELAMRFRVDPSLIAGAELHGRHVVVRSSWKADLERIREELNREHDQRTYLLAGAGDADARQHAARAEP
jgi:F-type H+-transporting ATPase subunit b